MNEREFVVICALVNRLIYNSLLSFYKVRLYICINTHRFKAKQVMRSLLILHPNLLKICSSLLWYQFEPSDSRFFHPWFTKRLHKKPIRRLVYSFTCTRLPRYSQLTQFDPIWMTDQSGGVCRVIPEVKQATQPGLK